MKPVNSGMREPHYVLWAKISHSVYGFVPPINWFSRLRIIKHHLEEVLEDV